MLWIGTFWKIIVGMLLGSFALGLGSVALGRVSAETTCVHYASGFQTPDRARMLDLRSGLDATDPYAATEQRWSWISGDYELITRSWRGNANRSDVYLRRLNDPTDPGQRIQSGVDGAWTLQARWSPDGERVAFIWRDQDGNSWLSHAQLGEPTPDPIPLNESARSDQSVNPFGGWYVHGWSGDGRWISLAQQTSTSFHYSLWSLETMQKSDLQLPTALYDAEWSPAEPIMAAIGAGDSGYSLWLVRPDAEPTIVQSPPDALFSGTHRLAWSRDGQYVTVSTLVTALRNADRQPHWRHDIYSAAGQPLALDITGHVVRVPVELDAYSQTVSTQDVIPAMWSGDGRWVTLENATAHIGGVNLELVAVDPISGTREVLTRGILPEYAGDMFAIRLNPPSRVRSDPFRGPFEPQGDYIVVPVRAAAGTRVNLLHLDDLRSEILVEDADEIVDQVLHFGVAQPFWSWGGERVAVVWMKDGAAFMSIAQVASGERFQMATGAMGITYHDWPRPEWLTYVTHHDAGQRLHLLNSLTGEDWMLVDSATPIDNWGVTIAPSGTAAAAMISPLSPGMGSGDLYVAARPGEPAQALEQGLSSWISFAPAGDLMAYFEGGGWPFNRTLLRVLPPDASSTRAFRMSQNISGRSEITGWSNCVTAAPLTAS